MPGFTVEQWMLAAIAAVAIGLSKAGFGGVGMVAILLMARVMPARESTGAILPMLIIADIFAVIAYRRHVNFRLVVALLPPAVAGVVCGWLLIPRIPRESFGPMIGWVTMALISVMLVQQFRPFLHRFTGSHPGVAWPFGWLAGVTTMLANAAGPVMTIYLLACRLPKMEFVGTAAWYFFAVNLLKVPFSASLGLISAESLMLNLKLAAGVVFGVTAGRLLLGKINQKTFEWLMIGFTFLGALRLIFF